jgi:hypothetical protein
MINQDCLSEEELDGSRSDRRGKSLIIRSVFDTESITRNLRATVIRVSASARTRRPDILLQSDPDSIKPGQEWCGAGAEFYTRFAA